MSAVVHDLGSDPADGATSDATAATAGDALDHGAVDLTGLAAQAGAGGARGSLGAAPAPPPTHRIRHALAGLAWAAAGFAVLGLIWQFASWRAPTLPGPGPTLTALRDLLGDAFAADGPAGKGVGLQLLDSVTRVFKGFLMAALVGIPLGLLIGTTRWAARMFNPIVQLLRPVSPLAWFPIWLAIMVKADKAAVWVIFISALWPVLVNTAAGAASVPDDQLDVARVFRFSRWGALRGIVIPHAMPSVMTGLRLSMGIAWMVIVAAEMLSASSGIGFFVWQSYNGPGLSHVLSAILLIGVVGVVLDLVFVAISRRIAGEVRQ